MIQVDYPSGEWDYLPIYRKLLEFQCEVRNATNFLLAQESATVESQAELAMQLEKIAANLRSLQSKLKSTTIIETPLS